jgi:hypothetical protein
MMCAEAAVLPVERMFDFVLRDIIGRHALPGGLCCRAMNATPPVPVPDYAAPAHLAPTHRLTPEQITFFRTRGYLAVENVMPLAELPQVRTIYDRLFNEDRSRTEGDLYDLTGMKEKGKKEGNMPPRCSRLSWSRTSRR